jgi:HEAT repeat protein
MRTLNFLTALTCLLAIATRSPGQDEAAALSQQLSSTDVQARLAACRDLAQLGVKAQGAVPQLIKLLRANDVDEQRLAALTLASVGESAAAAVPALMDNLTAKDAQARAAAAYALGKIGPAARAAAPALVTAAADEDSMVRHQVLAALRNIDPPHNLVVPLFAKMLGSVNSGEAATLADTLADAGAAAVPELVRALADKGAAYWACLALAEIGPPAAPAVPALGKLLRSDEAEVRMQALVALAAIGEASRPLAPQIGELVNQDKWSSVRYSAAYALGAIGDKTVALPALIPAMNDDDEFLRVTAAWAYVRLTDGGSSPDLEKAIATVAAGAVSTNYRVRDIAVRALADPDLPADLAAPAMKSALQGIEDPAQRMDIVDALASLGARVVPSCIESLEQKSPLRDSAIQLLIKLGPTAAPAVDALRKTLKDPQTELRREAMFALGAIGASASAAVDEIAAQLADKDAEVRHAACYALGKIGPAAAAALPKLQAATEGDDAFMQIAAVWAAMKIAPQDEELKRRAVPLLVKGLTDEREHIRIECAYSLGELGRTAQPAVAALQQAQQQDDSQDVRTAIAEALELIGK